MGCQCVVLLARGLWLRRDMPDVLLQDARRSFGVIQSQHQYTDAKVWKLEAGLPRMLSRYCRWARYVFS